MGKVVVGETVVGKSVVGASVVSTLTVGAGAAVGGAPTGGGDGTDIQMGHTMSKSDSASMHLILTDPWISIFYEIFRVQIRIGMERNPRGFDGTYV